MQANSLTVQNPFEVIFSTLAEIQKTVKELSEKTSHALAPNTPEPERLLTRKQLAEFLGISEVSVWARMNDGTINSYKIGIVKIYSYESVPNVFFQNALIFQFDQTQILMTGQYKTKFYKKDKKICNSMEKCILNNDLPNNLDRMSFWTLLVLFGKKILEELLIDLIINYFNQIWHYLTIWIIG